MKERWVCKPERGRDRGRAAGPQRRGQRRYRTRVPKIPFLPACSCHVYAYYARPGGGARSSAPHWHLNIFAVRFPLNIYGDKSVRIVKLSLLSSAIFQRKLKYFEIKERVSDRALALRGYQGPFCPAFRREVARFR